MSKITISKELAVQITKRYVYDNFIKMNDIATEFSISPNLVSKAIYYSIFYSLISPEEEKTIYIKITKNISRYTKNITVLPKLKKVLKDRLEYTNNLKLLKNLQTVLIKTRKLKEKIISLESELLFVESLNISDFIASEDEPDYIPPRESKEILDELSEIKKIFVKLKEENIIQEKIKNTNKRIKELEKFYSI